MSFITNKKLQKNNANILLILCWFLYTVSYLGKVNYSANITGIIEFYGVTKAQAGIAPTFFFFAYGIGQVVNGVLCKKYNMKWTIFLSLFASAAINLVVAVTTNFNVIKWLWLVNGVVLSMLWPTLVRLLSESMPEKDLGTTSVIMGTTVALGTLAIYGLSAVYTFFGNFKLAFYTAGIVGIAVCVIWVLMYKKSVLLAKEERSKERVVTEIKEESIPKEQKTKDNKRIFYISICVLCFCAIGSNLIKDGLVTWLPAILKEEYSVDDSISILLTVFLPIVAVFGNLYALKVHKKIPDFVAHCMVTFITMFVFTGVITGCLNLKQLIIMLIMVVVVNFLASSLNSLLTSIFPMFMRQRVNSGLCAGILNGFCYLGSTISSYGLGVIADNFGWKAIFIFLMGFCFVICLVCGAFLLFKKLTEAKIK